MDKILSSKITHKIRNITPLFIRQKIGPTLAFLFYIYRTKINKNYKKPKVLSIEDTINKVINENLSVIRFGDGEISLIDGLDLAFQKYNQDLVKKIEKIIKIKNKKLLICIPGIWENLDTLMKYAYHFNMHHVYRYKHIWNNLISYEETYGDTNMTRHYLGYKDKSRARENFNKLFSIWENKDVVLIEGEKSRLGVGNDMFDKTKSMKRILCPPENAYDKYEEIKKETLKIEKDKLILISLGPTAKVLAYDLFLEGYRVIDIGHIDMEYEMFLRKQNKQTEVPYKYFNEIHARNPEECKDENYLNQIIKIIK